MIERSNLIVPFFVSAISTIVTSSVSARSITLYPGESYVIHDPIITDVVVGSDKVVKAKPVAKKGIVLTGISAGDTSVKIWKGGYTSYSIEVHVTSANLNRIRDEIASGLSHIPKIQVKILGDNVVISGEGLDSSEKYIVSKMNALFPKHVIDYTTIKNDPRASQVDMVYLDVRIVEVTKSEGDEIGVKWDSTIEGPKGAILRDYRKSGIFSSADNPLSKGINSLPKIASLKSYLGIATAIDSKINLMKNRGKAKILARPLLSCKNGGKASFLSGGQVPFQTVGATGTPSTEFKDYGIKLDIQPTIQANGINTVIKSEVSSIDRSVAVGNVPGFLTRKTDTEFIVEDGKTIVLSGLVNIESSTSRSGIPILSDIPVVKGLFSSKASNIKKSELLIFVTPYLYNTKYRKTLDNSVTQAIEVLNDDINSENKIVNYNINEDLGEKKAIEKQLQETNTTKFEISDSLPKFTDELEFQETNPFFDEDDEDDYDDIKKESQDKSDVIIPTDPVQKNQLENVHDPLVKEFNYNVQQ